MKISLNSVRQYIDFELPPIDELVEKINAQLGTVEEVIELGQKYQGIIIARVVACEKHPNADKLKVCRIDDGGKVQNVERGNDGLVQVVCGAPNVADGVMVAWLTPGSTVPATFTDSEPFVLGTRELRGVKSNGMLASSKELAIGDSHEGILLLDYAESKPNNIAIEPGADFAEVFGMNDFIIDIENKMFTHRPDCFGLLGVAREISGILGHKFTSPERYRLMGNVIDGIGLEIEIENEIPDQVPRLMAIAFKNVEVKPSPLWLQIELTKLGSKPISNLVDVTNYLMLLTGQPLHAYDYDKVASGKLGARFARSDEKLSLLNGKTIELSEADMVITDGTKPIGLAGVMGGNQTEVSDSTRNIILECATFDMYTIRRTSMRHGLFTDAVTRYNKGQSPLQNPYVLQLAIKHLTTISSGEVASLPIDNNQTEGRTSIYPPVELPLSFVGARLGTNIAAEEAKKLLENVEFSVEAHGENLVVSAPFWRTDIELREDLVEEIGRLYGYDKLPLELPKRDITPASKDSLLSLKAQIRAILAQYGANELLTYSFVDGDLLRKVGQDPEKAFRLSNALSPDLQYYRLSLMPSLLDKIYPNLRAGYNQFALFELGKIHQVGLEQDAIPQELERLAFVQTSDKKSDPQPAYYMAKKYLTELIRSLNIEKQIIFEPLNTDQYKDDSQQIAYYLPGRSASIRIGDMLLGEIGEFKQPIRKSMKFPEASAGFELDLNSLLSFVGSKNPYVSLPSFPKVTQDITLKTPSRVSYDALFQVLTQQLSISIPKDCVFELTPADIYQAEDDADNKNISFHLMIVSRERTLTDNEVNKLLDIAAGIANEKLSAQRI